MYISLSLVPRQVLSGEGGGRGGVNYHMHMHQLGLERMVSEIMGGDSRQNVV